MSFPGRTDRTTASSSVALPTERNDAQSNLQSLVSHSFRWLPKAENINSKLDSNRVSSGRSNGTDQKVSLSLLERFIDSILSQLSKGKYEKQLSSLQSIKERLAKAKEGSFSNASIPTESIQDAIASVLATIDSKALAQLEKNCSAPSFFTNAFQLTRLFQRIAEAEKFSNSSSYDHILLIIVKDLIAANRVDKAKQIALTIQPSTGLFDYRSYALHLVVKALLQKNRGDEAVQLAEEIRFRETQSEAYEDILDYLLKNQQIEEAEEIAHKIPHKLQRSFALLAVVRAFVKRKEIGKAEKIATAMEPIYEYGSALYAVVEGLVDNGRIEEAEKIARKIPKSELNYPFALESIVKGLLKNNRIEKAKKIAYGIENGDSRSNALFHIVKTLVAMKKMKEAEKVIDTIRSSSKKEHAIRVMVESLLNENRVNEARKIASKIQRGGSLAEELYRIFTYLTMNKRIEEAKKVAESMPEDWLRVHAMSQFTEESDKAPSFA